MTAPLNQKKLRRPAAYNIWVAVFFVIVGIGICLFYYASKKIEYIWRWNRIPIYFVYQDKIEIPSEIDGRVKTITTSDKETQITVQGLDEKETYTVPKGSANVAEGEAISPGDTLASYLKWKPGLLIIGLWVTLSLSVIATIVGVFIGIIGGLCRISSNPALKWLSIVYIELIRGSPLLVQILLWYYVIGTVVNDLLTTYGMGSINAFWYGVASLACFAGAYVTEIVRAGIQSIHRGQTEAARSLGMTYAQSMRYIILPQALRRILPPLAGQFISLIKDSSLLGMIAIRELTKAAREVVTVTLQPFEIYMVAALLYLLLTFTLSMFVQNLEKRMGTN